MTGFSSSAGSSPSFRAKRSRWSSDGMPLPVSSRVMNHGPMRTSGSRPSCSWEKV
jgi:hypothetical protein